MTKKKFQNFDGHGNEKRNPKSHHLYEIRDMLDDSVFKYGISAEPVGEDGYSRRMRKQVTLGNLFVGWMRFFARILIDNIPGRKRAEELEDEHIEAYRKETGKMPRGNLKKNE